MRQILKLWGILVFLGGIALLGGPSVQTASVVEDYESISLEAQPAGKFVVRVPEEYATIQAAIDAAAEGATVLVGSGSYKENIKITKSLRLVGVGQERVWVQAADEDKPIIYIVSEKFIQVYLEGLTVGDPNFPFEQLLQPSHELPSEPTFPLPHSGVFVWATAQILLRQMTIGGQRGVGLMFMAPSSLANFAPQAILENVRLVRNASGAAFYGQALIQNSVILENVVGVFGDSVFIERSKINRNKLVGLTLQILGGQQFMGAIADTEISENDLGIHLWAHDESAAGSRLKLYSNRLVGNEKYAVVVQDPTCPSWTGEIIALKSAAIIIEGIANEFQNNTKGDLCPHDSPWPPGFRK